MRLRRSLALIACFALPAIALAEPKHESFTVPAEQVKARVRTIAIRPPRSTTAYDLPPATLARHGAVLERELARAGLSVVPAGAFARAWIEPAARLGGVYDPVSGEADMEKWKVAREHTLRELSRTHQIDAVLDWGYHEHPIHDLQGFKPYWLAAGEPLSLRGEKLRVYELGIGANRVVGLWGWLILSDRADGELYNREVELAWTELRLGARIERRGLAEFTGEASDKRVALLLTDLVRAFRSAPAGASPAPAAKP
jgi:hypothetical protein